jgi:enoyl-CoA hydratase
MTSRPIGKRESLIADVELEHLDGDAIAILTLDDVPCANAMSLEIGEAFKRHIGEIQADPKLRVAIIRGKGPDFSSGCPRDLLIQFGSGDMSGSELRDAIIAYSNLWLPVLDLPVPVISVTTGDCLGVAAFFVCAADVMIADETAKVQIGDAGLGYFPELALPFLMERRIGVQQAPLLTMARQPLSGHDAEKVGLVARCVIAVQAFDEAVQLAEQIASGAPAVIREIKKDLRLPRKKLVSEIEDGAARQAEDFQAREFRTRIIRSMPAGSA